MCSKLVAVEKVLDRSLLVAIEGVFLATLYQLLATFWPETASQFW